MPMYKSRRAATIVPAEVREFARQRGINVGRRGRFSAAVMAEFLAANPAQLAIILADRGVDGPKSLKKATVARRMKLATEVASSVR